MAMEEETGLNDVHNGEDTRERDEIFTKVVRAGKRTYFFDVKATRKDEYYLTITESKKRAAKEEKSITKSIKYSFTRKILKNSLMASGMPLPTLMLKTGPMRLQPVLKLLKRLKHRNRSAMLSLQTLNLKTWAKSNSFPGA